MAAPLSADYIPMFKHSLTRFFKKFCQNPSRALRLLDHDSLGPTINLSLFRGLKQNLWTLEPRDPTETKTELYLSVSCGGTGQQWTAPGTVSLDEADLGMA